MLALRNLMADETHKRVCFIIDDMGFRGGAHVATFNLIKALASRGVVVDVLAISVPEHGTACSRPITDIRQIKYKHGIIARIKRRIGLFVCGNWPLCQFEDLHEIVKWLKSHDTVCCISEASTLRWLVASLGNSCRKVQFIHTDYVGWTQLSPQSRSATRFDSVIYSRMDCIGIVGASNSKRLKQRFPRLADRIFPFYNLIDQPQMKAGKKGSNKCFTIATVGRPNWGPPKKTEFSIKVAAELKRRGVKFTWKVYGSGPSEDVKRLNKYAAKLEVADCFLFAGYTPNITAEVRSADIMALLSAYEGCANSIYEALLCGTPVIATDVGCASEQIQDNITGRIVRMDVGEVADVIETLIKDRTILASWKKNLEGYKYDNNCALNGLAKLLGIES